MRLVEGFLDGSNPIRCKVKYTHRPGLKVKEGALLLSLHTLVVPKISANLAHRSLSVLSCLGEK